ncbi:MAG: hypothetical protein JWR75_1751 [Devosia sp.]|nr:hypothetical protein [Devosia sp.]
MQRSVNEYPEMLARELEGVRGINGPVTWVSPLAHESFAEYRDAAFLDALQLGHLKGPLTEFWPSLGPQWDALGRNAGGQVLLVEAKAHIEEICSPGTMASAPSAILIEQALAATISAVRATPRAPWGRTFYQLANRLAHLHFLRQHDVDAHLILLNFTGDAEMGGPTTKAEWIAAYQIVNHVMGVGKRHPLSRYVHHVYIDVAALN